MDKAPAQARATPAGEPRVETTSALAQSNSGGLNPAVQLAGLPLRAPNRTGLPDGLKAGIESLSGMSLDHVKVHYNSAQPAQLNALAYAQGSDIHVAPGQERHLPHEAWHVVQQAQGRVRPTMQMKEGVAVNDDAGLEREAVGGRAVTVQRAGDPQGVGGSVSTSSAYIAHPRAVIQRLHQEGDNYWSHNDLYAVAVNGSKNFIACDENDTPILKGLDWVGNGDVSYYDDGEEIILDAWRPRIGGRALKVPKDCITTAELVSAWIAENDPEQTLQVQIPVNVEEADVDTAVGIGDILFQSHDDGDWGDFHAAAIIAEDNGDVVTMEADATAGPAIAAMTPIFDMYAGHAGFRDDNEDGGDQERTYVIHLGQGRAGQNLSESIGQEAYTEAGRAAADAIIAAIQDED